jgi:hypothetical protein
MYLDCNLGLKELNYVNKKLKNQIENFQKII